MTFLTSASLSQAWFLVRHTDLSTQLSSLTGTGFAALKPILVDSGVYSDVCKKHAPCKEQDTRLNFLFVFASSTNNVGPCGESL